MNDFDTRLRQARLSVLPDRDQDRLARVVGLVTGGVAGWGTHQIMPEWSLALSVIIGLAAAVLATPLYLKRPRLTGYIALLLVICGALWFINQSN